MFGPGSFRGDTEYDRVRQDRLLERTRNRAQDNFSGDTEAQRALDEAAEQAAERKAAARRARLATRPSLTERIYDWWTRRTSRK